MRTYIYNATDKSAARGFNRTITVYRIKHNRPYFVASNNEISTASYVGDRGEAMRIVEQADKITKYNLWEV
jgi:hypothetical protein